MLSILAIITISVIALGITRVNQPPANPFDELRGNALFPDLIVRDLVSINLRDPNTHQTFTLVRAEDGSWIAPFYEGQLDPDRASDIARTIVLLAAIDSQPITDQTNLALYGFDPNGGELRLFVEFLRVDQTQHIIAIGGFLPDRRDGYYVLVDDRPYLYTLPRGGLDFLIQSLISPSGA
jgi:hypothetical protein